MRTREAPSTQVYRAGPHPSPWEGPLAALDILLNNLGVGLFLVAAVANLVNHDRFGTVAAIAFVVAFAIIALDLLLLVVDLGDPFRFFHMLRVIRPRTPMSVGVWCLSLLMILLVPIVLISVIGWFTSVSTGLETLVTVIAAVAIVPAFGGLAYKGVLFSITAQPGWRDARWLGAHVCSSGTALGSAVLLLIAALDGSTDAVRPLRASTLALTLVSGVALLLLHHGLRQELHNRFAPGRRRLRYGAVLLFGFAVPVVLLVLSTAAWACALAAAAMLAAEFVVRLVFVAIPHSEPSAG